MKKYLFLAILCCSTLAGATVRNHPHGLSIWFDTPNSLDKRAVWLQAPDGQWKGESTPDYTRISMVNPDPGWESQSLPLGNGSIGANIMGSVEAERITFNEKTLWQGGPNTAKGPDYYWKVNKPSAPVLHEIRQAFLRGDVATATRLTQTHFNGLADYESSAEQPFRFGHFTTMGEFYIETGLSTVGMSDYRRELSLDSALAVVQFRKDDVLYRRQYFVSYPHNVMAIRFSASQKGRQHLVFSYQPNPVATGHLEATGNHGLLYTAHLNNNGMQYAIRIQARAKGGEVSTSQGKIIVSHADEVDFLITADTDYRINFDPDFSDPKTYVGEDPLATTSQWMDQAAALGYDALFRAHYADYSALFRRVQLHINPGQESVDRPTPFRLKHYRKGEADYRLEELYYQYGRYLLIASSRPGNLPAHLQGLWHNNVDGPWHIDYHNNINLQMNYWPACSTNLTECMLPLVDFIRTLVKPGTVTAQSYFGARGWTASISGNIFGFTSPLSSDNMSWNFNPMAGPWLATHIWDYYDYTRDLHFLKSTGYPLLRSSANFATDFLWHRPDGSYTAAPSTSPEHGPVDQGATFVHAVIREILTDAIQASRLLGVDRNDRRQWEDVLLHLAPYRIGRYGQLMEWSTDIDDPADHHRHVNHLFGLHPGHTISPVTTPQWAQASRVVLEHRGDGATGWSMGWKLNQWARLHDGNHAYILYQNLLRNGTLDNLWDTHPPFQIDGNFGGTAGITEMLMQSHMGFIHLLPALPDAWHDGSVSGLCARGNFEVGITWTGGQLQQVTLLSRSGGPCQLRYRDSILRLHTRQGHRYTLRYHDGALQLVR